MMNSGCKVFVPDDAAVWLAAETSEMHTDNQCIEVTITESDHPSYGEKRTINLAALPKGLDALPLQVITDTCQSRIVFSYYLLTSSRNTYLFIYLFIFI